MPTAPPTNERTNATIIPPIRSDRRTGWALVSIQFLLIAGIVLIPGGTRAPGGALWSIGARAAGFGSGIRVVGLLLIVVGAVQLGRHAHVHPAPTSDAVLRTNGLFRYVRHPIYTGVLIITAATTAVSESAAHIVLWCALVCVLTFKARFEETLLRTQFVDYANYENHTGRFLPRFGRNRPSETRHKASNSDKS